MNKLRLISIPSVVRTCLAIILVSLLLQSTRVQARNDLPPTPVLFPAQQQDEEPDERTAQLGENRGALLDSSEIWTYEGQVGDILTIKAEADKPANKANSEERRQAGLLDMLLIIYAPDGTIIAKADDIQPGTVTDAVIEGLQLPTDGTYKIEVLGSLLSSGAYTLTLQAGSATQSEPTPTINPDWPTLTIENQLEDTICYAYIWPTSADEVGDEWLGTKKVILPNSSHQWRVAPEEYNIVLSDCYGNTLDQRWNFDTTNSSTLTVSPLDDPAAQCAEGVQLYLDGKPVEAYPLLEAGFAGRESATFANPDDEAVCASMLGLLHDSIGNQSGALEAYQVARDIFQATGNRRGEGITVNTIGLLYYAQGKYPEALASFQLALEISKEVEDGNEGWINNSIGLVYRAQGKYAEGEASYEQALDILREVEDRAGEATTATNMAALYLAQGKYDDALAYYEQALDIFRDPNVGNRAGEGIALNSIGGVYHNQGKYDDALAYYEQALDIFREVGDRANEAETLNNIGAIYDGQGKYDQALEQFQQALEIKRQVHDRAGEGTTLNNIGGVYYNQGKYDDALKYYEQALEILREIGDRANEGVALNNIGTIYSAQGKYQLALQQFKQAVEIYRQLYDGAGSGSTLNNIGEVYGAQGKYDQALEQFQQALEISQEIGDRSNEGTILNNMGAVHDTLGKYDQALTYYEEALEIRREIGSRAGEGVTLNNIGVVYSKEEKYDEALAQFQQALEIRREVGDRANEGVTLNNIGRVYHAQEQYELALEQYQQALEIFREVGNQVGEGSTLSNMGVVYEQQGQAEEALKYYEEAQEVIERVRATAGGDEERASFIAEYAELYQRVIGLYHEQGQEEDAFYTSERGRARSFLDSLATQDVQLSDDDEQALLTREREAYVERQAAQNALAAARAQTPPDAEFVADLQALFTAAEEEYSKVQSDIEAQGDELAALVPGRSGVLRLAEVQALLDEQTTLLSYWVLEEEAGTLAFVITADEFTVVELPDATPDKITSALSGLYDWLSKDNAHPLPLQNLHSWLITPLAEHLKTPKVGLIAHQALHEVPFAALTDGERYFGEQYTLFSVPSASALSHIEKNAANLAEATQPALVFGNPTTGDEFYPPLPDAGEEAASVAELLGGAVYVETEADEARLSSEAVGAPVLHLAAHGSYNSNNALYSAIHLAPQGDDDGRLEAHEVYSLDLSAAEMVVLSACQSNVGEASAGDEMVGLTRAFFFAKTPTLVSSLWKVEDAATQKLMEAFYRNWQSGMGKAEALQTAQAELRESYPGPFYWAAFVLNGDAGEVTSAPQEAPAATESTSSEVRTSTTTESTSSEVRTSTRTESTSSETANPAEEGSAWWLIVAIVGLLGGVGLVVLLRKRLA